MTHVKFKTNLYPSRAFNRMMNPLFNEVLGEMMHSPVDSAAVMPAVNISENVDSYLVELAVPGLQKEDFKLNLEKNVLSISAEKKTETEQVEQKFTRKEFSYHSFKRSFNLPEHVEKDSIHAEYKDGILSLRILKKKEAVEQVKEIQIS